MNLLLFNLRTDTGDTTLGFTTSWVNALARRCERVTVVTLHAGRIDVEPNVTVHAVARPGDGRLRRLVRFYRLTAGILRSERVDVCFAHMTPLMAILFWPLGRAYRVPTLLWYAHGAVSLELRLAHLLADRCVTSTPSAFRLRSRKLHALGQGIDTERFVPPAERPPNYDETVVSVARLSPAKRIEEVIDAVARAGLRLELVGGPLTDRDAEYAARLGAPERVHFAGPVGFDEVPAAYHRGGVFVNLSRTGSLDKAILEAMASGCIPVSDNAAFAELADAEGLDGLVPRPDAAACIEAVVRLPAGEREALRGRMRDLVVRDHSLERLTGLITQHLQELAARPRERRIRLPGKQAP